MEITDFNTLNENKKNIILVIAEKGKASAINALNISTFALHKLIINDPVFARCVDEAEKLHVSNQALSVMDLAADESIDVARAKLRIESIKWLSSKLNPQTFGDKIQVQVETVNIGEALQAAKARVVVGEVIETVTKEEEEDQEEEENQENIFN